MYLLVIRHTESLKNVHSQFSSENDLEHLTLNGEIQSLQLARQISEFISDKSLICKYIYSANSTRSIDTARIIANELSVHLKIEDELRSTKPGSLAGKSEEEAKQTNPEFIEQLYLFRNGLYNAYDFNSAEGKESKKEFEKRVNGCVDKILSDTTENIKILVAHRSSITTILLEFAKKYYNYPRNFSGHIPLDLGGISILEKRNNSNWKILKINCNNSELCKI